MERISLPAIGSVYERRHFKLVHIQIIVSEKGSYLLSAFCFAALLPISISYYSIFVFQLLAALRNENRVFQSLGPFNTEHEVTFILLRLCVNNL